MPHTLRARLIAKLADNLNMNSKETTKAACHKNKNSQNAPVHCTDASTANKFSALKNPHSGAELAATTAPAESMVNAQHEPLQRQQEQEAMLMMLQQQQANCATPMPNIPVCHPSFPSCNPLASHTVTAGDAMMMHSVGNAMMPSISLDPNFVSLMVHLSMLTNSGNTNAANPCGNPHIHHGCP